MVLGLPPGAARRVRDAVPPSTGGGGGAPPPGHRTATPPGLHGGGRRGRRHQDVPDDRRDERRGPVALRLAGRGPGRAGPHGQLLVSARPVTGSSSGIGDEAKSTAEGEGGSRLDADG